jgi:hypothetical protein
VKLWFDEDLSPTLVQVAGDFGLLATCNRDRGMLGATDGQLRRVVQDEDYVLVTDNASDFRPLYARDDIHPGLIVIPAAYGLLWAVIEGARVRRIRLAAPISTDIRRVADPLREGRNATFHVARRPEVCHCLLAPAS